MIAQYTNTQTEYTKLYRSQVLKTGRWHNCSASLE